MHAPFRLPVSGSAYSYTYVSMGEIVAWIMGLLLLLEYGLAASTVAVGWSGYFVSLAQDMHIHIPAALQAAPGVPVRTRELGEVDEVGVGVGSPPGGDDFGNFIAVAADTWKFGNFFGDGTAGGGDPYATIIMSASTNPGNQIVKYLNDPGLAYQVNSEGQISGSGTYNQCTQTMSIATVYLFTGTTTPYKWIYNLHR